MGSESIERIGMCLKHSHFPQKAGGYVHLLGSVLNCVAESWFISISYL